MIAKTIMEQLHDINSMVIELIAKNYLGQSKDNLSKDEFWYEVRINSDGSLRLGFQAHIINNNTEKTYIQCSNNKDFEKVKKMLNERLKD